MQQRINMILEIKNEWKEAYNNASFYKSKQNTSEYWDMVAQSGDDGLVGNEHIDMLIQFLLDKHILDECKTLIDVGCGTGKYVSAFSKKLEKVIAFDYSAEMINKCKVKLDRDTKDNSNETAEVAFICDDFFNHPFDESYDISLALLNPALYCSEGIDKLLEITDKCIIYMTMDMPISAFANEPVYNGTNSIEYAEKYLENLGIHYEKLPYVYTIKLPDGKEAKVPFAFLICEL